MVVLPFAVLAVGGRVGDVAIVSAAQFLPFAVLALPAGVWADRLNHKKILVASDSTRFLCLLTAGLLLVTGTAQVVHLAVLAAFYGAADFFPSGDAPSSNAAAPRWSSPRWIAPNRREQIASEPAIPASTASPAATPGIPTRSFSSRTRSATSRYSYLERVTGIEPALSARETDLPHIAVPGRASDDRQYPRAEAPRGVGGHKRPSPSEVKAEFDCPVRVRDVPCILGCPDVSVAV
jgi:Transmembrane secretion effector